MVKGFYKDLLLGIIIVLLLLGVCVSIDYADDEINNLNESSLNETASKGAIPTNNSTIIHENGKAKVIVCKSSDVVHYVHPIISITAKPSCGCGRYYSYRWRTKTFINYCPHCHRYGVLANVHKWQARYEQELTCRHCGADYCGNCGKEKYSWSKYYLRKC